MRPFSTLNGLFGSAVRYDIGNVREGGFIVGIETEPDFRLFTYRPDRDPDGAQKSNGSHWYDKITFRNDHLFIKGEYLTMPGWRSSVTGPQNGSEERSNSRLERLPPPETDVAQWTKYFVCRGLPAEMDEVFRRTARCHVEGTSVDGSVVGVEVERDWLRLRLRLADGSRSHLAASNAGRWQLLEAGGDAYVPTRLEWI